MRGAPQLLSRVPLRTLAGLGFQVPSEGPSLCLVERLPFWLLFPCHFPCLCRTHSSPLHRHHSLQTRHEAIRLMSQLMRSIRSSRTQVPAIQTVVTLLCALLLVVSLAMISQTPACRAQVLVPLPISSSATCRFRSPVSPKNSPFSRAVWERCRDSSTHLPMPPVARLCGCGTTTSARTISTSPWRLYVIACLDALQSASVSSVETKSLLSDWPLPKVAGSAGSSFHRRTSQSPTLGESGGDSQPPGKRQKPAFMAQLALRRSGQVPLCPEQNYD